MVQMMDKLNNNIVFNISFMAWFILIIIIQTKAILRCLKNKTKFINTRHYIFEMSTEIVIIVSFICIFVHRTHILFKLLFNVV